MISKIKFVLGLGIWLAILPYLGFPSSLKNLLITLSALSIVYISYLAYKNLKAETKETRTFDNFSENLSPAKEA